MAHKYYNSLFTNAKDYAFIIVGLAFYALGFTAFILPHEVVMGGLTGVGTLVLFASGQTIPVAITTFVCNLTLLAIAYRIVGRTFVLRTLFGAFFLSLFIGFLEGPFTSLEHPLIENAFLSVILGGILCGTGIGTIFIHNGSSGGTDIVAAMVSKLSNQSIGRTIIYTDMLIVSLAIFLPFEGTFLERVQARVPTIVYGLIVTYLTAYMTDMIINTNRQAVQFIIFSHKWQEIATAINEEARRGVTILDGQGWYSKQNVKVLMVWCRKIESVTIFRIIKSIDEQAFIAQSAANGVYGKGFDTMRVKIKPRANAEATEPEVIQ